MNRTKKNMVSAVIAQIVTIITGFLVQHYILVTYGSTYNGLTSSVTQILQYLVLLEAGLTTATTQALYKPITQNDNGTISGILSATQRKFIKIGLIFLCALLISSIILPFVVDDEVEFLLAFSITITSGLSTGLTYMFINKYQALLYADNRTGSVYNLTSVASLSICIVKIIIMKCGLSIVFVQASSIIGVIIKLIAMSTIIRSSYPEISMNEKPRYDLINKSNNVLIHQIAGFIHNNTDVLLITILANLKVVSLYSVYNMVFSHINSLIQSVFAQAPIGYFGQYYAKDKEKYKRLFSTFEIGYNCIMFIIMTVAMELILSFVKLYTKDVDDIDYINPLLAWLFFIAQTLNLSRIPSILTVNVSGHFKETQKGAIIEAVINLAVSIPLFIVCGVHGLLIGTIAAMAFRSVDITRFTYMKICDKRFSGFFFKLAFHYFISVLCILLISSIVNNLVENWVEWILTSAVCCVITGLVFVLADCFIYRMEMLDFINMAKTIVRKRNK